MISSIQSIQSLQPIQAPSESTSAAATTSANQQPAAAVAPAPESNSSAASSQPQTSSVSADTAKISNAGQQALQESRETPAQTTHEASHGDPVAKRLLAKQAEEKANGF